MDKCITDSPKSNHGRNVVPASLTRRIFQEAKKMNKENQLTY